MGPKGHGDKIVSKFINSVLPGAMYTESGEMRLKRSDLRLNAISKIASQEALYKPEPMYTESALMFLFRSARKNCTMYRDTARTLLEHCQNIARTPPDISSLSVIVQVSVNSVASKATSMK